MDTTNKHDWGLVIAGVLLVICSMFFLFAPGLALVTITVIAGAAFLVSGIFDIVNYFRFRRAMDLSGWALAYGALDIVLGILFLVNPLVSRSSSWSACSKPSGRSKCATWVRRCGAGCCSRASSGRCAA